MDRLETMSVFAAVCDAKGFAPAARRLGLSPSVVTRQIAALETALGARLLQRTTRSLHLTEAGERYLVRARQILGAVAEAEEAARGAHALPRGRLVVGAPVIFGRLQVAPLLAAYMAHYPEVTAELRLDDRNVSLVENGIDVAIRLGALRDSTLIARPLGQTRRVVVASRAYIDRRGRPEHPAKIEGHDVIASMPLDAAGEWRFVDANDLAPTEISVPLQPRFTTNSGDAAIDFALADGGLARPLLYPVARHVAEGRLIILLDSYEPPALPIQAIYPSARWMPLKVRAFLDLAQSETKWSFMGQPPN